ncbi:hypothetical protein GCM10023183_00730 [Nibribacter koreensis]|uniref:Uncharacterized protein n=2 Tax=Nibribacter koreensis TaxID=1084519 RepID=A0ABP8F545_9BACT
MLCEKGYEVTVFVNDSSVNNIVEEQEKGVRVVRFCPSLTNSSAFLGYVTNLSYEFAHVLKQYVKKEGVPDVIESQDYQGIAYYLLQYKHLHYDWCKEAFVVITMHSPSFLYHEFNHVPLYKYPNYWIGEMERFCLQAASLIISPSNYLVEEVKKRFPFENAHLFILPNPHVMPTSLGNRIRKNKEKGHITFYGKLSPQKGSFHLLNYFKAAWETGFKEPLILVGGQDIVYHPEGRSMGDIIKKKYKKFLEAGLLQLEDSIHPSKIEAQMASSKVVVVPSTIDNYPYVVLEMMSLGLIVLVSKQGGQSEIVEDGVNGFVFDHQDPDSFLRKLKQILDLSEIEAQNIIGKAHTWVNQHVNPAQIFERKHEILQRSVALAQASHRFPFTRGKSALVEGTLQEADLVSVVVPYYNMGRFIDSTIASLQAIEDIAVEILLVNDGSCEQESLQKLDAYRGKPGIRVFDTKNNGLSAARNFGAEQAKGAYLAFLDADDMVAPNFYSKAVKVLKASNNVHFVGAWTQYFGSSSKVWPTFIPEPPIILYHNLINSSALLYRRESFLAGGQNDTQLTSLEDYDSVISMLGNSYYGVVLPEVLFYYRVRKKSMFRKLSKTKKTILKDYIVSKHKELYAQYASEVINLLNTNGPGIQIDNPTLDYYSKSNFYLNNMVSTKVLSLVKKHSKIKKAAYQVYKVLK